MPKLNIRKILFLFIIFSVSALLIVSVTYYIKKKRGKIDMKAASVVLPKSGDTAEKMTGITYNGVKDGKLLWELTSGIAVKDKQSGVVDLDALRFVYHSEEGYNYYIAGSKGSYDESMKTLKISGSVLAHTEDGYDFKAKDLTYSFRSRTFEGGGGIELKTIRSGVKVTGDSLKYDMGNQHMSVSGNVKTTFAAKEAKKR